MDKLKKLKKALGRKCKTSEPMDRHTTLKIGGGAALFVEAKTEEELIGYIKMAKRFNIDYFILAGGSNLLVSDSGFDGVVIKNGVCGIKTDGRKVRAESGTILRDLIDLLIGKGLKGMEKMCGIPGTVGGAIYGNAGAYGQEVSDNLIRVKVFDGKKEIWLTKSACRFGYRDSVFKNNRLAVLAAEFNFRHGEPTKLKTKANEILKIRQEKYPDGLKSPGSYFKNVLLKDVPPEAIRKIPKEKIMFDKIPAGYLLGAVGANGKEKGKIRIASYHANLFINRGGGKASDFLKLAKVYSDKVKKKFGIELEPEVRLVGFGRRV